jgi:hypothetical protein
MAGRPRIGDWSAGWRQALQAHLLKQVGGHVMHAVHGQWFSAADAVYRWRLVDVLVVAAQPETMLMRGWQSIRSDIRCLRHAAPCERVRQWRVSGQSSQSST